ncbi:MAG: hypothetical protein GX552_15045 [Chloroflexi bacterium]|nr:hypothetical protein [Chloroflexota bacterium]
MLNTIRMWLNRRTRARVGTACLLLLGAALVLLPGSGWAYGRAFAGPPSGLAQAYLPLIENHLPPTVTPTPTLPSVPTITPEPGNREQARRLYLDEYLASEGTAIEWSGNHASCNPGNTAAAFRNAVLRRVNYFRAMAGLPLVTLNEEYNRKAQAAALMMSANRTLSHDPSSSWTCYSAEGDEAAGKSNLYLGRMGWEAISGYVLEDGELGHRRWILYPQTQQMGTGDVPATAGYMRSNTLWVFDSHMWDTRPATRDGFVAWPPPGYVPYQVVNEHWSFSYPGADFSNTSVTVTSGGAPVAVSVRRLTNGYGENTLAWVMADLPPGSAGDVSYHIELRRVRFGGADHDFAYDVTLFDPTQ